jgi:hypothetical protein
MSQTNLYDFGEKELTLQRTFGSEWKSTRLKILLFYVMVQVFHALCSSRHLKHNLIHRFERKYFIGNR